MHEDIAGVIEKVLISEEDINQRIGELAEEISRDYQGRELMVLSVLSGSFMFAADLTRALKTPVLISFIYASSYGKGSVGNREIDIRHGREFEPKGKDILIIEDIMDTGRTLAAVRAHLLEQGAKSVEICTFLDKPSRRLIPVKAKYVGFDIPDEFVVGYGLDYGYKYRQFPFVGVLKPELYTE